MPGQYGKILCMHVSVGMPVEKNITARRQLIVPVPQDKEQWYARQYGDNAGRSPCEDSFPFRRPATAVNAVGCVPKALTKGIIARF